MKLHLSQLDQSGATTSDVATFDGTDWVPGSVTFTEPLFADDGSGPVLNEAGDGWVYPD